MERDDSIRDDSDVITISRRDLAARQSALRKLLARLEKEADAARTELAAVDAVLTHFAKPVSPLAEGLTIREMATEVMTAAGVPVGVKEITDAIRERFGATVARTSLSPMLKKMEQRGDVRHIGDKWLIVTGEDPGA